MKVVIALNAAWNLVNFRSGLIRALVAAGHEVVAVAPYDEHAPKLEKLGCRFEPLPMDNKGTHPGRDLMLAIRFRQLLRREKPAVLLAYTVKPNIYGSLAARTLKIPVINNVAGLGSVFIKETWLTGFVKYLYRLALARSFCVFFQNGDDKKLFLKFFLVREDVAELIPGSGIDLEHFSIQPVQRKVTSPGEIRFLLIARMLWDKGVGEYVRAAQLVRQRYPDAEFCLLGFLDVENPAAVSRAQMDQWVEKGDVIYLGEADDVRPYITDADCVVLPSYREGTPRTLLEAAAMGRPIVTTDAVGCREVVEDNVNGYLCKLRDAEDLADKLERMLLNSQDERMEMGLAGRRKVEKEFDEALVISKYLAAIDNLCTETQ